MSGLLKPLHEIVTGWDPNGPQTGVDLWEANPDDLDELARDIRRHIASAVRASDQVTFTSPSEVRTRIEAGHIRPKWRKWETLALDRSRQRIMIPDRDGGVRAARWVTKRVPTVELLEQRLPLAPGAVYLLFYWGNPTILSLSDKNGARVCDEVAALRIGQQGSLFRDLILWDDNADTGGIFSLAAGVGNRHGTEVSFPDVDTLNICKHVTGTAPTSEPGNISGAGNEMETP